MPNGTYTTGAPGAIAPAPEFSRISWGAIIAGVIVVIVVHFLLILLGIGIGLVTTDTATLGAGSGDGGFAMLPWLWWIVSNLIALLAGGYITAYLLETPLRENGVRHGIMTWATSLVIALIMMTTAFGFMAGGAFSAFGTTLPSLLGAGDNMRTARLGTATDTDPLGLEDRIYELLLYGDPTTFNAAEARRALVMSLGQVIVTDDEQQMAQARDRSVAIITRQTNLTPEQATLWVDNLRLEFRQMVEDAAGTAASASFWNFLAFLLGAIAAGFGGALGVRRVAYTTSGTRQTI